MSVIITFMFEPAKLQMNCASASGTRTRRSEPGAGATSTDLAIPEPYLPLSCGGRRLSSALSDAEGGGHRERRHRRRRQSRWRRCAQVADDAIPLHEDGGIAEPLPLQLLDIG